MWKPHPDPICSDHCPLVSAKFKGTMEQCQDVEGGVSLFSLTTESRKVLTVMNDNNDILKFDLLYFVLVYFKFNLNGFGIPLARGTGYIKEVPVKKIKFFMQSNAHEKI